MSKPELSRGGFPVAYFEDDTKWIASQIKQLPVELWSTASEQYSLVFAQAYNDEQGGRLLKLQAARTTANTRLRKYVAAVLERLAQ